jgi:hypothetical protein
MADVRFSIISPLGHELQLATSVGTASDFRVMLGTTGFGLPTPLVSTVDSAGDGRRVGNVRVSGRTVTLAIEVHGDSRAETEENLNVLADHVSYIDGKPFPRFRATYPNGTAREVEFLHIGGGVETFEDDETVASWVLTLDCPDPYWTAVEYESFSVQQTAATKGFLESLPNVYLLPTDAFGAVDVTNPGRVESWIDWELKGPFTRVEVNGPDGDWAFEAPVPEGSTIYVRKTAAGIEVVDETGANRFADVDDVPQFFRLPAGASQLTVDITGATTATKAIGRYKPRYRLVF